MNKKKIRIELKPEPDYAGKLTSIFASQAPSTSAPTSTSTPLSTTVKANSNKVSPLAGIEDIGRFDSAGVPFILVDGVCLHTRQQLHSALFRRERKRMKQIQRQCNIHPMLEYTEPVKDYPATSTDAEKAAQENEEFQGDLKLLTIAALTTEEKWECSHAAGTLTPLPHASSDGDMQVSLARLKQIKEQLTQLRQQQERQQQLQPQELQQPQQQLQPQQQVSKKRLLRQKQLPQQQQQRIRLVDTKATPPKLPPESVRIRREATFDVLRDEVVRPQLKLKKPIFDKQRLIRATTTSQLPIRSITRPFISKVQSTTSLVRQNAASLPLESCEADNSVEKPNDYANIIGQIGDLLMQLPQQQEQQKDDQQLVEKGSYSFLVTVTPKVDCGMESFSDSELKLPIDCDIPLPSSRNSVVRIYTPILVNGDQSSSSVAVDTSLCTDCKQFETFSSEPAANCSAELSELSGSAQSLENDKVAAVPPHALTTKSRTFLKMPSTFFRKFRA